MNEQEKREIKRRRTSKTPYPRLAKHSEDSKRKMSESHMGAKNPRWKGENASFVSKHIVIHNRYGKADKCENLDCKYPRKDARGRMMMKPALYNWANLSGYYHRDMNDWVKLCVSCHRQFDCGSLMINLNRENCPYLSILNE